MRCQYLDCEDLANHRICVNPFNRSKHFVFLCTEHRTEYLDSRKLKPLRDNNFPTAFVWNKTNRTKTRRTIREVRR